MIAASGWPTPDRAIIAQARAEAREVAVEREAAADGSQRQGDAS